MDQNTTPVRSALPSLRFIRARRKLDRRRACASVFAFLPWRRHWPHSPSRAQRFYLLPRTLLGDAVLWLWTLTATAWRSWSNDLIFPAICHTPPRQFSDTQRVVTSPT